jgi:tetratricopeptide (TPR) repeat protein
MKDYYSTLNIAKTATVMEIKKAYFALVRVFPPDRHPEEFMKIREAYEILVDENTRQQYNLVDSMPDIVKSYFQEGQKALNNGDIEISIRLLEQVIKLYPNFSVVNSLLGEAYLRNENSGKAIRIFENLVAQESNNAGFVRRLANAYAMRGWHKKAIKQYRWALTLDEDNLSLWLGLIDCYHQAGDLSQVTETVRQGIEVSNREGWDNLELYYHMIQIDIISKDQVSMKKHLAEMKNKALEKEEEKGNVAWFLASLAKTIQNVGLHQESAATIEAANELLPDDEELKTIKKEIDSANSVFTQLEKLEEDQSFNSTLAEMLNFQLHICGKKDCLDCEITQSFFEMDIVIEIRSARKEILQLKNSYPELYNLKKQFFDDVLNRHKEVYLQETYRKKLKKYQKLRPERFEPDEDDLLIDDEYFNQQPYTRPEPKVGRNDPCPCGSGKKYKKCCGK